MVNNIILTWLLTGIHENVMQSNLFNMGTKGGIESVLINRMCVFKQLEFRERFLSLGTKESVRNYKVSVLSGYP